MKVGILPNIHKESVVDFLKEICFMWESDIEFIVSNEFEQDFDENCNFVFGDLRTCDVILTLGGDGTIIKASRIAVHHGIPILGVNLGHLGFLAEIRKEDLGETLLRLKSNKYYIEERMMLEITVTKDGKTVSKHTALNDVIMTRKTLTRLIGITVKVNGQLLDDYYADGVIVSSPTGSTGYSLSAGGPVLDPLMEMMLVIPICPHSLHSRSVAVSEDRVITLESDHDYNKETVLSIDGQINIDVEEGMVIEVRKADVYTRLIKFEQYNFYELLRRKLLSRGDK